MRKFHRIGFVALFLFSVSGRPAESLDPFCSFDCSSIPPESESVLHFGESKQETLAPEAIRILVWNTYKANKKGWVEDFERLAPNYDVLLLQEGHLKPLMDSAFRALNFIEWAFGVSFIMEGGHPTGVTTGSLAGSKTDEASTIYKRTTDTEPFVGTPKVTLGKLYRLKGLTEKLLTLNIHAINFTKAEALSRQLQQMSRPILEHTGPVVFGGDFNTWNENRRDATERFFKAHGFKKVAWSKDPRTSKLDHVFIRGLSVQNAEILSEVKSSDHLPLSVTLAVPPALQPQP